MKGKGIRDETGLFMFFALCQFVGVDTLGRLLDVLHCVDPGLGQTVIASNPSTPEEAWSAMSKIIRERSR